MLLWNNSPSLIQSVAMLFLITYHVHLASSPSQEGANPYQIPPHVTVLLHVILMSARECVGKHWNYKMQVIVVTKWIIIIIIV